MATSSTIADAADPGRDRGDEEPDGPEERTQEKPQAATAPLGGGDPGADEAKDEPERKA
jgi:hypothetical protein